MSFYEDLISENKRAKNIDTENNIAETLINRVKNNNARFEDINVAIREQLRNKGYKPETIENVMNKIKKGLDE